MQVPVGPRLASATTTGCATRGYCLLELFHRLHSANEGAHEFPLHLRSKGIDIDAFAREELPCILDRVDPRRPDTDRLKPGPRQLPPVFLIALPL